MSSPSSGQIDTSLLWAMISGTAALILSIVNFYFEHIKGARVRALAWNVQHQILGTTTGGNALRTTGSFAFTNEGNRSTVITKVIMTTPTGDKLDIERDAHGHRAFPIALPPQETKSVELAVQHTMSSSDPNYTYEFETYRKQTGKVEVR